MSLNGTVNDTFDDAPVASFAQLRHRIQGSLFSSLPELIARLDWDGATIARFQQARLRDLLTVAQERSPFHRARLGHLDPERFRLADLAQLPVMTKHDLMANFDDAVTDPMLTLAGAEHALATTGDDPRPLLGRYVGLATGGSSGERGVFVNDAGSMAEFVGLNMRAAFARAMAAEPATRRRPTIAFVTAASPVHGTACVPQVMSQSPVTFVTIPVTLPLGEIVDRLNATNPTALHSYPSMLAVLAREQRAGRLRLDVATVTATSENLEPTHRPIITEAFQAPLVNNFACTEGLVGASDPDGQAITFASDACLVELVDEHHQPVPLGTPSARVLITNLYNRVQPLIRYQLNDSFTRVDPSASDGHLRALVHGRADGVLHYRHAAIHSAIIMCDIWKHPEIIDYQVVQTPAGIQVAVQAFLPVDCALLRSQLATSLVAAGLVAAEVDVTVVAKLDRNASTGKLRRFIPLAAGRAAA